MEYKIKATRRETGETWFAYDGQAFSKERAESIKDSCVSMWGKDIDFSLEPKE